MWGFGEYWWDWWDPWDVWEPWDVWGAANRVIPLVVLSIEVVVGAAYGW